MQSRRDRPVLLRHLLDRLEQLLQVRGLLAATLLGPQLLGPCLHRLPLGLAEASCVVLRPGHRCLPRPSVPAAMIEE
ncbi:hypothetical protein [Ornithinimicrobium kibberense]|uniref:hypothetical protein n=1 Tax=Ornithinimicrobium kibberense TaxID=282060 RepID=UPI003611E8C3